MPWLFERNVSIRNKTEDGENFFKAHANTFRLTLKLISK